MKIKVESRVNAIPLDGSDLEATQQDDDSVIIRKRPSPPAEYKYREPSSKKHKLSSPEEVKSIQQSHPELHHTSKQVKPPRLPLLTTSESKVASNTTESLAPLTQQSSVETTTGASCVLQVFFPFH